MGKIEMKKSVMEIDCRDVREERERTEPRRKYSKELELEAK